jgi:hypothetical protein
MALLEKLKADAKVWLYFFVNEALTFKRPPQLRKQQEHATTPTEQPTAN